MYISEVRLENWRNFGKETSAELDTVSYVLGVNASGKSNLLDALRFLRDVAKPVGGGLQFAIDERGGIRKIRCLHAKGKSDVILEVTLVKNDGTPAWKYRLSFNLLRFGTRVPVIKQEVIHKYEDKKWMKILDRPKEKEDSYVLSETYIEQKKENIKFLELVDFLAGITYVHLVPQLLKFANQIGGNHLENDPFGQGFLVRIAKTPEKTKKARLKKIEKALLGIVPNFKELESIRDKNNGRPHLEIRYDHYRKYGAKQLEDQFSDGTLRLIGLLWMLQEGGQSPLLLEEPELSLNEGIIEQIPIIIDDIMSNQRSDRRRQVIITTHSRSLLSNKSIGYDQITVIEPKKEGSALRSINEAEKTELKAGLSPADAVLHSLKPKQYFWDV